MNDKSSESDFVQIKLNCSLIAVQRVVQKNDAPSKTYHSGKNDPDMTVITFSHALSGRVEKRKKEDLSENTHEIEVLANAARKQSTF